MLSSTTTTDNTTASAAAASSSSSLDSSPATLSFPFRGRRVPVTYVSSVPPEHARLAVECNIFVTWYRNCEQSRGGTKDDDDNATDSNAADNNNNNNKRIEIHGVEIQSVDMFGARGVGFLKIKTDCTLSDDGKNDTTDHEPPQRRLPGICFLRGNGVAIFVALYCEEDGQVFSLLVEQPRIPIGQVACLEIPAGMLDNEHETVAGIAVQEMQEECGIAIKPCDLVDLSELARGATADDAAGKDAGRVLPAGISSSPGGCDEFIRYMYLEKKVTIAQLDAMRGRLQGLRDHGEYITLKVVPMADVWRVSGDAKVAISLFLVDQLRREGKLAPAGALATPLGSTTTPLHPPPDPVLELSTTSPTENGCRASIPQLAFGLYNIPNTDEGEQIIEHAIAAGYRHFDGASIYGNEVVLGRALRKSGIPRKDFFITSKVWNDAVKAGRDAVRKSVEKSLADVDFGGYFDLFLVHWPVSDHFVEAYQVLEEMHEEKLLYHIGLSNFDVDDYEELVRHGLSVPPVCNQFEVSPVMYRPNLVRYFQDKGIIVCASKGLGRGGEAFSSEPVQELARKHSATPAQIFLRWGLQKNLVVASKTSMQNRLLENRSILHFTLSESDINVLDDITTEADIKARNELEKVRKSSL